MEEIKKEKTKKKKALIISIIALITLLIGTTLAIWTYNYVTNVSSINTGEVKIEFLESTSDVIAITNAVPLPDEDGKIQSDVFTFQVTTKAAKGKDLEYNLYIEKVGGPEGYTQLSDSNVKIYLTDYNDNSLIGPVKISELENYNLYSKTNTHTNGEEIKNKYKLRIWVDESAENSYDWSTQNKLFYNFKIGVSTDKYEPPVLPASETIIAKVGTDGIVAEEHPETEQLGAVTDYRYTGANPNNYVRFNNELWRIIGVFPTEDASGKIENRIKIIRDESIGDIAWDVSSINDWSTSSLQQLLNSGDYYNRTGNYASNGLTSEAKSMINDAKWYLGGTSSYTSASNGLASHWYSYERGTDVYSGRPTSFIGEVGLMYPSDYGYATSGGSTTNREECLAKELYNWYSSSYSDCKNNDWLFNNSDQWTMAPYSGSSYIVFYVRSSGSVYDDYAYILRAVRPVLALASTVEITGGTGTESDPYILGI